MKRLWISMFALISVVLIASTLSVGQDGDSTVCQVLVLVEDVTIEPESNANLDWEITVSFEAQHESNGVKATGKKRDYKLRSEESGWKMSFPAVLFIDSYVAGGAAYTLKAVYTAQEWDTVKDVGENNTTMATNCNTESGTIEERTNISRRYIWVDVPVNNPENETASRWTFDTKTITNPIP